MTKIQRIKSFFAGIIMLAAAAFMFEDRKNAYPFILFILSMGFFVMGIRLLIYYFTMARFMTGGKLLLYRGFVLLDLSFLTGSISDIPRFYILLYLAVMHGFAGLVEILRASEAKKYGAKSWRLKFIHGLVDVFMALCCIIFIRKTNTAVYIYSLGLVYSALLRIITAFRRSTFVYIQ